MRSAWSSVITGFRFAWVRSLFVSTFVLLALAFVTARPLRAQTTYPITGTAGFETGLQKIANLTLDHLPHLGDANPAGATIEWGDGTFTSRGLLDCSGFLNSDPCDVYGTHRYAVADTYTITITYSSPQVLGSGPAQTVTTTATISPVGNFVILSIGDSIASGEGNPPVPWDGAGRGSIQGYWDDPGSDYYPPWPGENAPDDQKEPARQCHRSLLAGPAQAAHEVAATNPATFVHFACSGATVDKTWGNTSNAVSQLRVARESLPRIDVLLISAGANNMHGSFGHGFGGVITRCLKPFDSCADDPVFQGDIQTSIAGLPDEYAKLAEEINCINPDDGTQELGCTDRRRQIPKLVLMTEYEDPTHNENGEFSGCATDPGITAAEWSFLYNQVVVPLNQQVDNFPADARNAGLSVPTYAVTGIPQDFSVHGYCAGSQRWVIRLDDSSALLGTGPDLTDVTYQFQGTGHPISAAVAYKVGPPTLASSPCCGQEDYRDRIYNAIVVHNPPVTLASATADGAPYTFGTWTNQDVEVTLSAKNPIKESGLRGTFYAVDNPDCQYNNDFPDNPPGCSVYGGPYTISTTGQHTVTFFSENTQGNPDAQQSAQVLIDKNPPVSMNPGIQTTRPRQSVAYTVDVGHFGWENQTVNLSCTTDDPRVTCTMAPSSVTLDQTSSIRAVALVSFAAGSTLIKPGAPTQPIPMHMLEALRALLALATGLFLAAAGLSLQRRRWARVSSFAAFAVLLGTLCAGCGEPPAKTYTVTVTGASGNTTNTASSTLVVR